MKTERLNILEPYTPYGQPTPAMSGAGALAAPSEFYPISPYYVSQKIAFFKRCL
jgi:hypothetical protein